MPVRRTSKSGGGGSIRDLAAKSEAYKRLEADIAKHKAIREAAEHEAAVAALAAVNDAAEGTR